MNDDFDGSIDDVRVYNRALSASDIAQLVKETQSYIRKPANNLGMVAWWKMDEGTSTTAHDSSGNGFTATSSATSTSVALPKWVTGKFGNAIQFDGASGYLNVNSVSQKLQTGAFTVSEWFKLNTPVSVANPGPPQILFALSDPCSSNDIFVNFGNIPAASGNDGQLNGQQLGAVFDVSTAAPTSYAANTWYHVVYTFDQVVGGNIYLNGVLSGSNVTTTRGTGCFSTHAAIGGESELAQSVYSFNGTIDDVRIYSRALSATEVANLYQTKSSKVASVAEIAPGSSLNNSLIAWWTFDGKDVRWPTASQAIVYDRSGMGNNGSTTGNMTQTGAPTLGKIGQSFYFTSPQYVTFNHNGFFTSGNHPFTMAAWVNPDAADIDGNAHFIALYNDSGVNDGTPVIAIDSNGPEVSTWGSVVGGEDCISSNAAKAGKWIHIVGVYDGSVETLYVNGAFDKQCSPPSLALNSNSVDPHVGDNAFSFYGKIDDVRIYNRALSDREIKQLYKLGQATLRP